jgi:beta-lactam-binding protein with PASTA domain
MPSKTNVAAAVLAAGAFATACTAGAPANQQRAVTVTASAPVETITTAPATSAATAAKITVPDVSGMNHQDAQDKMQAAGLYNLREVDSTGKGRVMVLDRNWCQTGQDPKAGTEVDANTVITLYADKC